MSTRASIIYSQKFGLHIYQELLDDTVHIEIERNGFSVDVVLGTFAEWVAAGCPTRLALDGACTCAKNPIIKPVNGVCPVCNGTPRR